MRVRVVAVGRLKRGAERDLAERYLERARAAGRGIGLSGFDVAEIAESRGRDTELRRAEEASAIAGKLEHGARRVVLDERGRALTSAGLAETIADWRDKALPEAAFLVGGPDGHGSEIHETADLVLSFGAMTWPHQLARVMLAEQLYRAITILSGHPYHRA